MKSFRKWLIKQGYFSPASLKEARELFSFPVKINKSNKQRSIWMQNHLERVL